MSELNSKARALLVGAHLADEPTQADYDRIHSALEARIAVGVAVGVAATLGAQGSSAAATAATVSPATAGASAAVGSAVVASTAGAAGTGLVAGGAAAPVAAAVGSAVLTKVAAWVVVVGAVAAVGTTALRTPSRPVPPARVEAPSAVVVAADAPVRPALPAASTWLLRGCRSALRPAPATPPLAGRCWTCFTLPA